jgi:hypothetical protein
MTVLNDGTLGLGVVVALVALIGAALLAIRCRQHAELVSHLTTGITP